MSAALKAICYLIKFKYEKEKVIETLERIEMHMMSVNEDARTMKTVGNTLAIVGTVAAPFTFGMSLLGTVSGIALNVASSFSENRLMSSLLGKVQKATSELQDSAEKIKNLAVDWYDVAKTLCKSVMDGFTERIFEVIPQPIKDLIKNIPRDLFLKILISLRDKIVSYCNTVVTMTRLSTAANFAFKQVVKSLGKDVGKRILFTSALVGVSVLVDVVDIIQIWRAGDPEPVKQVRKVIEDLKAD